MANIENYIKPSYPLIAGILLIISGLLAILTAISTAVLPDTLIESYFSSTNLEIETIKTFLQACIVILLILSIFSILGGILSIRKKLWGFALTAAILAIFTFGPLFASSVLAIISVILIIISKNEFKQ